MNTLNFDILVITFDYLSTADIVQFSTVSKAVYSTAIQKALTSLTLTDKSQLHKTCAFLFSDPCVRLPLVRGLRITQSSFYSTEDGAVPPDCASDIWRLLTHTTNLRRLQIERVDVLLDAEPRIKVAIAALVHLDIMEYLEIASKHLAAELASNLQSRPRMVIFDFRKFDGRRMVFRRGRKVGAP